MVHYRRNDPKSLQNPKPPFTLYSVPNNSPVYYISTSSGAANGMEGLNYSLHSSYDVISNSDLSEADTSGRFDDSVDRLGVEGQYETNSPNPTPGT